MISRHGSGYSSYTESSEIIVHEHIASDFRRKSPLYQDTRQAGQVKRKEVNVVSKTVTYNEENCVKNNWCAVRRRIVL